MAERKTRAREYSFVTAPGFSCDRCGRCCREHRVPVTLDDVARLSVDATLEEYLELVDLEHVDMIGEPETVVKLREGRRLLVLKHRQLTSGESACIFLHDEGSCTLHQQRPLSCRSYPYDRSDAPGLSVLGLHPRPMCPEETGIFVSLEKQATEDPLVLQFMEVIRKRDEEASIHAEWIQEWNRRQKIRVKLGRAPKDESAFLSAVRTAAARRRPKEPTPSI